MTTIRIVLAIAAVLLALAPAVNTQSAASVTVLRAARMFDSATGRVTGPAVIVVSGGKIQSIGSSSVPAGATVIDLGGATLVPGFIDAHTHLGYEFNPDFNGATLDGFRMTVPEVAIRATANARKTLMAGFTTARDLGASDFVDVGAPPRFPSSALALLLQSGARCSAVVDQSVSAPTTTAKPVRTSSRYVYMAGGVSSAMSLTVP